MPRGEEASDGEAARAVRVDSVKNDCTDLLSGFLAPASFCTSLASRIPTPRLQILS